jgi:hypothetical protein
MPTTVSVFNLYSAPMIDPALVYKAWNFNMKTQDKRRRYLLTSVRSSIQKLHSDEVTTNLAHTASHMS